LTTVHAQANRLRISTNGRFCCTEGGTGHLFCSDDGQTPQQLTCEELGFGAIHTQARWGQGQVGTPPSGVGFDGIDRTQTAINSSFFLGTLYHQNWPIVNWANRTKLTVHMSVFVDDVFIKLIDLDWLVIVDETKDIPPVASCTYPSTVPCADSITMVRGN